MLNGPRTSPSRPRRESCRGIPAPSALLGAPGLYTESRDGRDAVRKSYGGTEMLRHPRKSSVGEERALARIEGLARTTHACSDRIRAGGGRRNRWFRLERGTVEADPLVREGARDGIPRSRTRPHGREIFQGLRGLQGIERALSVSTRTKEADRTVTDAESPIASLRVGDDGRSSGSRGKGGCRPERGPSARGVERCCGGRISRTTATCSAARVGARGTGWGCADRSGSTRPSKFDEARAGDVDAMGVPDGRRRDTVIAAGSCREVQVVPDGRHESRTGEGRRGRATWGPPEEISTGCGSHEQEITRVVKKENSPV